MRELTARELSRGMLLAEEEAARMGHGAVVPVLLPPKDLRASAFRHRLRERYHNDRSRVVSFVKDLGAGETSRVDVYYSTGTIAIARWYSAVAASRSRRVSHIAPRFRCDHGRSPVASCAVT